MLIVAFLRGPGAEQITSEPGLKRSQRRIGRRLRETLQVESEHSGIGVAKVGFEAASRALCGRNLLTHPRVASSSDDFGRPLMQEAWPSTWSLVFWNQR